MNKRRHRATIAIAVGIAVLSLFIAVALSISTYLHSRELTAPHAVFESNANAPSAPETPAVLHLPRCTGVSTDRIKVWDTTVAHGCHVKFWQPAIACNVTSVTNEHGSGYEVPHLIAEGQLVLPTAKPGDAFAYHCTFASAH